MSLLNFTRLSAVLASAALTAGAASAGPGGGHGGGGHAGGAHVGGAHVGGAHVGGAHYAAPHYGNSRPGGYYGGYGGRTIIVGGLGYGGYGYGGLGYGGLGYGSGYYGGGNYGGYGYGSSLAVPVVPGTYSAQYPPQYQAQPVQPLSDPNADPTPLPLPNGNAPAASGEPSTAKITVITNEGAKVSFEGIESDQTGTRHSFTTKPLSTSAEARVKVTVDGSTISIGVRGGEKATVDMRK